MKKTTGALLLVVITCISAASMEPLLYGMQEREHPASGTISGSGVSTRASQGSSVSSRTPQASSAREISISQSTGAQASQPAGTTFYTVTRAEAEMLLSSIMRNHRNAVQEPLEPPSCWERTKEWVRGWCKNSEPYMSDEAFHAFISQHMQQALEEKDLIKIKMFESLITARNQQAVLNNQNNATRVNFIMTAVAAVLVVLMPFISSDPETCECVCQ